MRSSKPRSRNKSNRNRPSTGGNIVNRVFDSSGPEGKVRGTPQQIIDKYNQLARDSHLGNDRVATENFQQHAEHYMRILSAAQREQDSRREEQERQNRERQAERDRERAERDREREERDAAHAKAQEALPSTPAPTPSTSTPSDPSEAPQPDVQPDVMNVVEQQSESGLVQTPEANAGTPPLVAKPKQTRRPRRRSAPKTEAQAKTNQPEAAPVEASTPKTSTPKASPAEAPANDKPEAAE